MDKFDKTLQEAKNKPPANERYIEQGKYYIRKTQNDSRIVTTPEQVMRGVSCKKKVKEGDKLRVESERVRRI